MSWAAKENRLDRPGRCEGTGKAQQKSTVVDQVKLDHGNPSILGGGGGGPQEPNHTDGFFTNSGATIEAEKFACAGLESGENGVPTFRRP